MSPDFLAALADALLPGAEALPAASAAGIALAAHAAAAQPIHDALARTGELAAFLAGDETTRTAMLRRLESGDAAPLRALVTALLCDYYEAPAVLAALGWSAAPPQPAGHALPPDDAETAGRLERVRRRGPLWRA